MVHESCHCDNGSSLAQIYDPDSARLVEEHRAAKVIQAVYRKYVQRHDWCRHFRAELNALLKTAVQHPDDWPKAQRGSSRVYLPLERPEIVIKEITGCAAPRIIRTNLVRQLVDQIGASNVLVVPKNICRKTKTHNYLFEEKLLVSPHVTDNIKTYLDNLAAFNDAVVALTRLFAKGCLDDILDISSEITGEECYIRYDNLPLFLSKKDGCVIGKVGLIDLEYYSTQPDDDGFYELITCFPRHANLIKEEASKCGIFLDSLKVISARQLGDRFLNVRYCHPKKFIEKHIKLKPFLFPFDLKHQIVDANQALFEKLPIDKWDQCWSVLLDRDNHLFFVDEVLSYLEKMRTKRLENIVATMSIEEKIVVRRFREDSTTFYSKLIKTMKENTSSNLTHELNVQFLETLERFHNLGSLVLVSSIQNILNALKKSNQIASFVTLFTDFDIYF